jgi:hypothetical protein
MRQLESGLKLALIAGLLAVTFAGCGSGLPPDCRIDDLDDQQMSTRVLFLERLNGCTIGGR